MPPQSFPMTARRLAELRAEPQHKAQVERLALTARLEAAVEMGDLSENGDYHAAKETQGFLEGRIQELQSMILGAEIIEENEASTGVIQLGSRITVVEVGEEDPEIFQLVGQVEANPREGKISN